MKYKIQCLSPILGKVNLLLEADNQYDALFNAKNIVEYELENEYFYEIMKNEAV